MAVLFLATPSASFARVELESQLTGTTRGDRVFLDRLETVLALTEKRIRAVFGVTLAGTAVAVRSSGNFDVKKQESGASAAGGANGAIEINTETVRSYPTADLQIACARGLYPLAWQQFSKPVNNENALAGRLYIEGMTAYAAELLFPGMKSWQYAGLYGKDGKALYRQYIPLERSLAEDAQRALAAGQAKTATNRFLSQERTGPSAVLTPAGKLLSYRIMKTFETIMDPKMIQLMDFAEFQQRLPAALDALRQGLKTER